MLIILVAVTKPVLYLYLILKIIQMEEVYNIDALPMRLLPLVLNNLILFFIR
jgi:hypothetical protein